MICPLEQKPENISEDSNFPLKNHADLDEVLISTKLLL